ncbi:hypothetical protein MMC25_001784 [Agyrium rufum]|nr:hypothetical protein [Agyrium rufum]
MPSLSSVFQFPTRAYTALYSSGDPYNEGYSIKALLEEPSSDSSSTETLPVYQRTPTSKWSRREWILGLNVVLFVLSATFLVFSEPLSFQRRDTGNYLIRKLSGPSPILDQIEISLQTVQRNGSFTAGYHPTIYRQPPSDEVDLAWARISTLNPVHITSADVVKLGGDPSETARFPAEFGYGPDAHVARIDAFHLLHCLDALRREAYFDYYFAEQFPNGRPDETHMVHVSHCISMLAQNIMCNVPLTPVLHYWVDTAQEPSPNFSDNHRCQNFDAVLEWQEEKSLDLHEYRSRIRRPADVVPKVMPQDYKDLIGFKGPEN